MRRNLIFFSIFFLSFFCCNLLSAQQNSLDKMLKSYTHFSENHLHEKIFLHTDRSFYICGDILWFKTYITNGADNKPATLSKVVYVELLNKNNQPVLQAKIACEGGSGSGSFSLPFSIESGNYELRAYTNWMKNDSAFNYFNKVITIVNTTKNLEVSQNQNEKKYFANFFPEGGNLVFGINSVVGFKVNDNTGKGIEAKGVVIDEMQDTAANFITSLFGMGKFSFKPQQGKHYTAIITMSDSSVIKKNLPDAYNSGYVMHLSDKVNNLQVSLQSAGPVDQNVFVIAQSRGHIDFARHVILLGNEAALLINKDSIKEGITTITLFKQDGEPVAERLYFKRPQNELLINAKSDKQNYNVRSKVNIGIGTSDILKDSLSGNISMAVYKLDSLNLPDNQNIYSYLWLSSELKGTIEDPGYYFKKNDPQINDDLDNLLLTQGWRTFDWKQALNSSAYSFEYVPENYGHFVTARVINNITEKPASNILVYLSVPGKRIQVYGCISNQDGYVHFNMKDFYGPSQVVLQTNTTKDSLYHLEIFSPFSEKFSDVLLPGLNISENQKGFLQEANLAMQIQNAYHQRDLERLQSMVIDTLPFYYKPNKTYLLDNYTRFTTMEEVLREYVREVNVEKRGKKFHLLTFNEPGFALHDMQPQEINFFEDPFILLDGVPVFDVDKIIAYDPLKVQKLDIVTSRYYWGAITADGLLSYTTYKGNLDGFVLNPHDLVVDYHGLQEKRVFYSPDYSTDNALKSRLPDFRQLLYWSPDIKTLKGKDTNVSFYTGDVTGKYLVVLQGISSNGLPGATNFILDVVE